MVVYLAGPLTAKDGYTVEQNTTVALDIYRQFVCDGITAICPHLSALVPGAFDMPYECWMEHDFNLIDLCSHILMLPRWETSSGACREKNYAERLNKVILYSVEEVYDRHRKDHV